jgi:hypothetical protein
MPLKSDRSRQFHRFDNAESHQDHACLDALKIPFRLAGYWVNLVFSLRALTDPLAVPRNRPRWQLAGKPNNKVGCYFA